MPYTNQILRKLRKFFHIQNLIIIILGYLSGYFLVYNVPRKTNSNLILIDTLDPVPDPLKKSVTILCWVMTSPSTHQSRARYVKNTWGRNCNHLVFMSTLQDSHLGSVALPNVREGRDHLWAKTKAALLYLYLHHQDSADWFFKADDDTFAILSNMRHLLRNYSANEAVYLGMRFEPRRKNGTIFASGGAGYILSKKALQKVVQEGLDNPDKCRQDHDGHEDEELGKCLTNIGISLTDPRDENGAIKFMPYMPEVQCDKDRMKKTDTIWFRDFTHKNPVPQGLDGCSPKAVTFHYVNPQDMYELDYLVNHLQTHSRNYNVIRRNSNKSEHLSIKVNKPNKKRKKIRFSPLTKTLDKKIVTLKHRRAI